MGETGCGKTALVEFLCKALDVQLFQFDVHGGYTECVLTCCTVVLCLVSLCSEPKVRHDVSHVVLAAGVTLLKSTRKDTVCGRGHPQYWYE